MYIYKYIFIYTYTYTDTYTYIYIFISDWILKKTAGSLDFRLKTGCACFQAIGAVWELVGGGGRRQDMPV